MEITAGKLTRYRIESTDIFLEDLGPNQGKIIVSNPYDRNYSYYWGAMGGDIAQFIKTINPDYFASKLLGSKRNAVMDVKRTFTAIRKYIAKELDLPFYKHMEFQKSLREAINDFQATIEETQSQDLFISLLNCSFISRLDYCAIPDRHDRESVKRDFEGISEPWNFIETKPSDEYKWLYKLHKQLKRVLNQQP